MNRIIERIEREAGIPSLASILAEKLSPTDLQSLLLEVYRIRSNQIQPSVVLSDFESNRFVRPSAVSPTSLLRWEQIAFSHLPREFESIALSPVCPFGTSSIVSSVDQNWSVTTARNTEVVSDSTNVLALECAIRRRDFSAVTRSHLKQFTWQRVIDFFVRSIMEAPIPLLISVRLHYAVRDEIKAT